MKRIRVMEVLATLGRAGAENMAVLLGTGLDEARYEVSFVSLFDPYPNGLEPVLEQRGIPVQHLHKRWGFDPRMYPRLFRAFRQFRPDVVHTHSYIMRYTLPVGLAAGVPVLVHTVHNVAEREVEDRVGRMVHQFAFRRRVLAISIADEVTRSFRRVYGCEPAATIPNGIDTVLYQRPGARERWRQANGFEPWDFLIVSVARLEPQKRPLDLIEAFASTLAGAPRVHLLMAGKGSLTDAAKAKAAECGVAEQVHFLGLRSDVPDVLAASDLFALASEYEGNPLSVMEALSAGVPVVAPRVGGIPELVDDGVNGILVPPGDLNALAEALSTLARDPQRRCSMVEAARAASSRFGAPAMVSAYSEVFERALKRRALALAA